MTAPTVEPAGVSEERLTDHELRELHGELCEIPFYSVKSKPHRSRIAVAELLAVRQQLVEMRGAVDRDYKDLLAVLYALRDMPTIPVPRVLSLLSKAGKFPDDWDTGKVVAVEGAT